jgi:nitroimidazol reductase NimA-like FMN-containing flavoprotein (pyridoxamine 5'-phosphate oxidase superfamily)
MPSAVALNHDECLRRMAMTSIGRVAVTSKALPAVVPVNFVLSGNTIVFRTEPDGMLARACDGTVVAFEIDDLADDGQTGWSVLVVGVAELLDGSGALRAVETGLVSALGPGLDQFVAIRIGTVTGRSVAVPTTKVSS